MPRSIPLSLCVLFVAGCAAPLGPGASSPVPVSPGVRAAGADPSAPPTLATLDSALLTPGLADSLADAAALAQLEDAIAPGDGEGAEIGVTWDIDVTTYAEHDRVRYYVDFFQGRARERMAVWLERMPVYETMIRRRLQAENLPEDLIYLALIESGFSNTAVSRSRAVGMWQFMEGTGKMFGLRVDRWVDERRDPVKATDAAARYLAMLTKQFGSPYVAAAAYNGGPGRVSRGLQKLDGVEEDPEGNGLADGAFFQLSDSRHIKQETKDYVPKLIAAALIAKQPERYGFAPARRAEPFRADSVMVKDAVSLEVIARLADTSVAAVRALNPQFLRGVTPPGRTSVVRLPAGRGESTAVQLAALPASERGTLQEHVVRRGESLGVIAGRYGVSVQELQEANPRVRPRALQIGQTLVVPVVGGGSGGARSAAPAPASRSSAETHTVRRGETLSTIARLYGVSTAQLRARNELSSDRILVGQTLRLPTSASAPAGGVPAVRGAVHVVRQGETLSELAERYDTTVKALMAANRLRSTAIKAGVRLKIPT